MSVPSMGFTFMALGAFGDLPSAGAGSDRVGHAFPFRCRFLMPGPGNGGRHLPDA